MITIYTEAVVIDYIDNQKKLSPEQLEFLFTAQRKMFVDGLAVLGLTSDLHFLFNSMESGEILGMLAVRREEGLGMWVQLAYTVEKSRRRGVFRELISALEKAYEGTDIGFGVSQFNTTMMCALQRIGYAERVRYFWKRSEDKFDRMLRKQLPRSGN